MTHEVDINVQTSLTVCKYLSNLLTSSFGPNALQVMYTSTTGKVLLTSDGSTILGAMHVSHPVGRWLIDRVIKFHTRTGDYAKSFVFLVTNVLEEIAHELDSFSESVDTKSKDIVQQEKIIKLGRALRNILNDEFPGKVLLALLKHSFSVSEMCNVSVNAKLLEVFHTHLSSHLTPKQAKFISTLLVDFLNGYAGAETGCPYFMHLQKALLMLLDNFKVTCLETVGLPYESSCILDGIIISRDTVTSHPGKTVSQRNFVILGFNPQDFPEQQATVTARTVEDLLMNMQHTREMLVFFVNQLVHCHVTVLLSPECLSTLLLSLLSKAAITVVHTIPSEEIQRISHVAGVDIIHEISSHLESPFIGVASEVKPVMLGSQRFTQITLDDCIQAKHLILCSPSEGMCKVLSQAVCNALRCVRYLLATNPADLHASEAVTPSQLEIKDGRQRGLIIPAGGAAELIASDILHQEYSANRGNYYHSAALKITSKALLAMPRLIHQNSFAGKNSSFLTVLNKVQSRTNTEHVMGIDGKSGELCSPCERGAVECMASKYLLWTEVVETVLELLKMDMIIPVSRTSRTRNDDGDGESQ